MGILFLKIDAVGFFMTNQVGKGDFAAAETDF